MQMDEELSARSGLQHVSNIRLIVIDDIPNF